MDSLADYDSEEDEDYVPGEERKQRAAVARHEREQQKKQKGSAAGAAVIESDDELEDAFCISGTGGKRASGKKGKASDRSGDTEGKIVLGQQTTGDLDPSDPIALANKRRREREAEDLFAKMLSANDEASSLGKKKFKPVKQSAKKKKRKVKQSWEQWISPSSGKDSLEDLASMLMAEDASDNASSTSSSTKQESTKEPELTESSDLPSSLSTQTVAPLTLARDTKIEETDDSIIVTELKEYAGKTITLRRKIPKGSQEEQQFRQEWHKVKKAEGNLGNLLAHLTKSKKISTLDKTRVDWEEDKEKEGDEHELEQHAKSAKSYIGQQEFLQAADYAKFEKERLEREKDRTRREAQAKKKT